MRLTIRLGICLSILVFWGGLLHGQGAVSYEALFQKLQSEKTSDEAFEKLLKLGKKQADVREYLAAHLPEKIAARPGDHIKVKAWKIKVWENDVALAGGLRIVEAIPALIQYIDVRALYGDAVTLTMVATLADYPSGRALAQIGEPAVPSLSSVLETGDLQKRGVAIRALDLIDAPAATEALSKHLPNESDPRLKAHIERVLKSRRAGLQH